MPSRISFSKDDMVVPRYRNRHKVDKVDSGTRRSLSRLHTVTISARIEVGHLPFRPLRCSDPGACNFNEDITALFISSNKTASDCCSYSCKSTTKLGTQSSPAIVSASRSTSKSATKPTSRSPSESSIESATAPPPKLSTKSANTISNGATRRYYVEPKVADDELIKDNCQKQYLYMGIGIGAGACLAVVLILILFCYCCLKCMGYRLSKISKKSVSDFESEQGAGDQV